MVADDGTTTTSVDINITVNPVNDSPVISSPTTSFNVSDGYSYTILATDVDGDNLTYSLVSAILELLTDNVVSWNDIASDVYVGSFIVNVSDGTLLVSICRA